MKHKIIIFFLSLTIIFNFFGCKRNIQPKNTNESLKIITAITSNFNEVKGFKINYNSKLPIQKLNLKYDSLTIKLNFIDDRAYLSLDKENNTFIDWKPIKINFNYDVSFEDTEKNIHLLLQKNNISEGYLLFPAPSNESVKYFFYYFTIENLEYIGEYGYYPFKEGSFIYDEKKQELYISSDKKHQLTKKEGNEENDFTAKIIEKDLQFIKEEKGNFKYIKNWKGIYSFEYGRTQMGESIGLKTTFTVNEEVVDSHTTGQVDIDIIDDEGNVIQQKEGRKINRKELYDIVLVKQDTLKIVHSENPKEEHILHKDKNNNYFIKGSAYLVPAPDIAYPLTKNTPIKTKYLSITEDKLRVRSHPSLESEKVEVVSKSDSLEFLGEKSTTKTTVTNNGKQISDYWYKVKTPKGNIGWVHGCCVVFKEK